MPLATFDERVKRDLELCGKISKDNHFIEITRRALRRLRHGEEEEVQEEEEGEEGKGILADVVGGETSMARTIEALSKLLLEAGRSRLTGEQFRKFVVDFGLNDRHQSLLAEFYDEEREVVLEAVNELTESDALPSYHDLQWRLDVQLHSRFLRNAPRPSFVLKLDTSVPGRLGPDTKVTAAVATEMAADEDQEVGKRRGGGVVESTSCSSSSSVVLESDYATLRVLDEELDAALSQLESTHCKRLDRYIH